MIFDENALGLNFTNDKYALNTDIHLLGGYDYVAFKKMWHCGFQTSQSWPRIFSYDLDYKQNDSIGDARTNWELNRNFQFALLAKDYFISGEDTYLEELKDLFDDWNQANPFLTGIAWTSIMEVAIRSISWMYCLAFLKKTKNDCGIIIEHLENGIINMVDYVSRHYSRFSSANNHLLVEAASIAIAGYAFQRQKWIALSIKILTEEIGKQNYADGVNKELSLHYQTFGMEAYALVAHVMVSNGGEIPKQWLEMLPKMCEYVSHCIWKERIIEFGDDDEGKILDLKGKKLFHPEYVLQLCSLVLNKRYSSFSDVNETVNWLFDNNAISHIRQLPLYDNTKSRCFDIGGNSFLRDISDRIIIGIDHADLGFGSIAAHGHADALSFQMLVDGNTIFTDPGTYIYHCNLHDRNEFRKTINHNTLCINSKDQSEMLGAFLWGRKAKAKIISFKTTENKDELFVEHDGYMPIIHKRCFNFDKVKDTIVIKDVLTKDCSWCSTFMLGVDCVPEVKDNVCEIRCNGIYCKMEVLSVIKEIKIEDVFLSLEYGKKVKSKAIRIYGNKKESIVKIEIKLN